MHPHFKVFGPRSEKVHLKTAVVMLPVTCRPFNQQVARVGVSNSSIRPVACGAVQCALIARATRQSSPFFEEEVRPKRWWACWCFLTFCGMQSVAALP